jgi:hypothetical protein
VERFTVLQSNEQCKNHTVAIAGNIASHHLTVTERGVRVQFLGLQEDKKPESPITGLGQFTLEVRRNS